MKMALRLLILQLAVVCFAGNFAGAAAGDPGVASFRMVIVSSTQMIVQVPPTLVMEITVKESEMDAGVPASFMPVEPVSRWILVTIDGGLKFESKKQYVVTLTLNDGKDRSKIASVSSFLVDTNPKVALKTTGTGLITLESSVAFSLKGSTAILSNNAKFCKSGQVIPVARPNNSNTEVYFSGSSFPLDESSLCQISESKLGQMPDAQAIGTLALRHSKVVQNASKVTGGLTSLSGVIRGKIVNVFGDELIIEQTAAGAQPAPQKKEDAWLWANGTITAGTGAVPAWVLDGLFVLPNWEFWWGGVPVTPVKVSANIGNNKIGGVAAKDVIDFEVPSLMWLPPVVGGVLRFQVPASLTLETNRAFTHRNLLGVGDVIWDVRALNRSQAVRTAEEAANKTPFKMPPQGKFGKDGYKSVGWMLQFHTGFEGGGALATTTVTNPKTKATIGILPTYSIARFVPQIDGLYQYRNFSVESYITGRYLFTTEHTAVNDNAGIPYLETVSGWKAVNVLTFTYSPGASPHIKFNVAYTEGFSAPTYQRANGVKIGLAIAY
jgi:hypothetical protein